MAVLQMVLWHENSGVVVCCFFFFSFIPVSGVWREVLSSEGIQPAFAFFGRIHNLLLVS